MIPALKKKPQKWLTLKESRNIFKRFKRYIEFDEPIPPFETRFQGQLEGILNSVKQTYAKKHLNPTVLDAAAAYFNQLIRGHPFKNGNKRMAVLLTHVFLLFHSIDFSLEFQEIYKFAVEIALASETKSPKETKQISKEIIKEFTKQL